MRSPISTARDSALQILYLKSVDSTQKYLKELVKNSQVSLPYAVVADIQTNGVGSRANSWESIEGNLFLSFALKSNKLPKDLKLESASIYFSYLLKETLCDLGSKVMIKWPNDFYIGGKKTGGMITNVINDALVCGVGLNMAGTPNGFAKLDIEIDRETLLKRYFSNVEKADSWKQVFSKYKLEFYTSQKFYTNNNSLRVSLEDARLQSDGSIVVNGERIYSLR